jgi:hypothetical protein
VSTSETHFDRTVTYTRQVLHDLDQPTIRRILDRMHDARGGWPSGHEPPAPTVEVDEDGNPTSSAIGYGDRTGTTATRHRTDQAAEDARHLAHALTDLYRAAQRVDHIRHRYGQVHHRDLCRSCRRAGFDEPAAKPRYRDLCRFCGDSEAANDKRPTPVAIVRAYRQGGWRAITDHLIANNPIDLDDGRTVTWQRPKRKAAAA